MKYLELLAWVDCEATDCDAGWHCPEHQSEVPC